MDFSLWGQKFINFFNWILIYIIVESFFEMADFVMLLYFICIWSINILREDTHRQVINPT